MSLPKLIAITFPVALEAGTLLPKGSPLLDPKTSSAIIPAKMWADTFLAEENEDERIRSRVWQILKKNILVQAKGNASAVYTVSGRHTHFAWTEFGLGPIIRQPDEESSSTRVYLSHFYWGSCRLSNDRYPNWTLSSKAEDYPTLPQVVRIEEQGGEITVRMNLAGSLAPTTPSGGPVHGGIVAEAHQAKPCPEELIAMAIHPPLTLLTAAVNAKPANHSSPLQDDQAKVVGSLVTGFLNGRVGPGQDVGYNWTSAASDELLEVKSSSTGFQVLRCMNYVLTEDDRTKGVTRRIRVDLFPSVTHIYVRDLHSNDPWRTRHVADTPETQSPVSVWLSQGDWGLTLWAEPAGEFVVAGPAPAHVVREPQTAYKVEPVIARPEPKSPIILEKVVKPTSSDDTRSTSLPPGMTRR